MGVGQGEVGLVGRDSELSELGSALDAAIGGRGQLCLVAGEPGIGKSTLADAIAARAEAAGAVPVWGRAWEAGGAPAFWPWVQVVRALSRSREPAELRGLLGSGAPWVAQIMPELREVLPDIEAPASPDTPQARFALFDAVAAYLRNVSEERPLFLVFDDFHAADPPSLLMLDFLVRNSRDARICALAAYQEAAARARPEIDELVSELAREARRIVLRRLGEQDVRAMLEARTSTQAAPDFVRELHVTTDGNPLFVNEVVRLLADEDKLDLELRGDAPSSFPLPGTIRETVRQRAEPLGADVIEILGLAAVSGRAFRVAVLQRVAPAGGPDLAAALEAAEAAGLVAEVPNSVGLYRFTHGLFRQTLYDDLATARRIQAHGAIGDALVDVYGVDPEPHLAELAHHFISAAPGGFAAKAVDYAARAGERAMHLLAYEEADRLFARALAALELLDPDPERRAELLLALGRAHVRAGDPAARDTLLAAARAARTLDRPELLAEAALGFRAFSRFPGVIDDEVVALLEEALDRVGPDQPALRARLLVRLAVQLFYNLDAGERRDELVDMAVELARSSGDGATLAYVLINAQLVRWSPDRRDEALAWGEEALGLAQRLADTELALTTRNRKIDLLLELDDITGADLELEELDRLARDVADPRAHAHVALQRSRRAALEGRFEDAERLTAEAEALGARVRDPSIPYVTIGQTWARHWGRGTLGEVEAMARAAADAAPGLVTWRAGLARVYCETGREAEAHREFERLAASGFADMPRNDNWLIAMANLTDVCAHFGDVARAARLYELLEPFAGRNVVTLHGLYAGPVDRYLGVLSGMLGERERGAEQLAAAYASAARLNARPAMAIVRLDEARVLATDPEAAGRALELLDEAAGIAAEIGASGLADQAEELRERLGGGTAPAPAPAPMPRAPAEAMAAALRREGDVWVFDYADRAIRVKDSKGLHHLAQLLESPGVEVHALELVGGAGASGAGGAAVDREADLDVRQAGSGDSGPLLDSEAKAAYRARLEELREEIEEAESFNDPERGARAREELEFVTRELAGAVGLGGRDRKTGSDAERARVNATRSIRTVLKRVAEHDEALGRELEATVRTGTFCAYEPDPRRPVSWTVERG